MQCSLISWIALVRKGMNITQHRVFVWDTAGRWSPLRKAFSHTSYSAFLVAALHYGLLNRWQRKDCPPLFLYMHVFMWTRGVAAVFVSTVEYRTFSLVCDALRPVPPVTQNSLFMWTTRTRGTKVIEHEFYLESPGSAPLVFYQL